MRSSEPGVFIRLSLLDLVDGDYPAAMYLSQIIWYHQTSDVHGRPRTEFRRDGHNWLLRADDEWWDECRLSQRTVRRVRKLLVDRGLIEVAKYKRDGAPTSAVRPLHDTISSRLEVTRARQFQGSDASASVPSDASASLPPSTERPSTERETSAATALQPADGQLDLGASARSKPKGRAGKRASNTDPANAAAIKVAQPIWDSKDPRPTSPFVALVQLVRGFLEAGWTDDEVTSAGKAAPVLTRNAMELQLRQARQPAKANGAGSDDAIRKFRNRNNRSKPTPKRGDFIDVKETSNGR